MLSMFEKFEKPLKVLNQLQLKVEILKPVGVAKSLQTV
jgi:hypothetical protein